jgi:hypothetical protein
VFEEWITHLEWVIASGGESFAKRLRKQREILNKSLQVEEKASASKGSFELKYSTDLGIRQGATTFWRP